VLALAVDGLVVGPVTPESDELRWVDLDDVVSLPLHAGLGSTWQALRLRIDEALNSGPLNSGPLNSGPFRPS
jgi:hypothetical protein